MSGVAPVPGTSRAWSVLAVVVVPVALVAAARWLWAIAQDGPILYGEGAVAHAAILARRGLEYGGADGPIFVAANYPPLFFHLAGLGDPFVAGRVASVAASLFVAGAIVWRARAAGPLVAAALGAAWLASAPVAVWGAALKPDIVALAFTVGAVLTLDRRRALVAGALVGLAIWTKPTAALPAVALLGYLIARDRPLVARFVAAGLGAALVASLVTHLPDAALLEHVVAYNALGWDLSQATLLGVLALIVAGGTLAACALTRAARGTVGAYALGAIGVVVLGGREGATFNYLLDLVTAATLALATVAPRLRPSPLVPAAVALQTVLALALLDPLGILPGRAITTGAWSPPGRVAAVAAIPGELLVEDSGLLVATGREPAVDDLFLWSRLHDRGVAAAGPALVEAVRAGRFAAIVSETDLARLETAPLYERQRWSADLAAAVTERYRLRGADGGLFVYEAR